MPAMHAEGAGLEHISQHDNDAWQERCAYNCQRVIAVFFMF